MNIWLIQLDEVLPTDSSVKKMRIAMLADKLVDRGHKVMWWRSAFNHNSKTWLFDNDEKITLRENYQVYAFKGKGYKKNISIARFMDHRKLAKRFLELAEKEEKPDIIVASSPAYDVAKSAVKFAKKYDIPVIVDIRDEWPKLFLNLFPKPLRFLGRMLLFHEYNIFKYAIKNSTSVVAVVKAMLDWGLQVGGRAKRENDRVLYIGCYKNDDDKKLLPKLEYLNEYKDHFVVTYVGTIVYNGNPKIFVDCAEMIQDEKIHIVVAGDGEMLDELKNQAANLKNISFPGWLDKAEFNNLLKNSQVGLSSVPYYREIFSNKIFSYFASDLPIITSYGGEVRDIINRENLGFYFEPGDIKSLKEYILKLYKDRELYNEMRSNVKSVFPNLFDADKIYDDYADHIEKCYEEKHGK